MALLALVLALALAEMLLPMFDKFLQRPIGFHYAADWPLLLALVGVAIAAGLVSGSYPALVLSGFQPAATLRTNSAGQAGSGGLRSLLVVLQFAVSIGLGIAALRGVQPDQLCPQPRSGVSATTISWSWAAPAA